MSSINPTNITTRKFHIHLEDEKNKSFDFSVDIEAETLKTLTENTLPKTSKPRSTQEKEFDVIRSIVEKAFLQKINKQPGDYSISISKTNPEMSTTAILHGKGIVGEGFYDVGLTLTPDQDGVSLWKRARFVETTQHKTMLQRFSKEENFSGVFKNIEQLLKNIFNSIGETFDSISQWYKFITDQEDMPWSQDVLAKTCRLSQTNDVPLKEALKYISKVVKSYNPHIAESLKAGIKIASKIEKAQSNEKKITKILNNLYARLEKLPPSAFSPEALFIPIKIGDEEALLKITRSAEGYDVDCSKKGQSASFEKVTLQDVKDILQKALRNNQFDADFSNNMASADTMYLVIATAAQSFKGQADQKYGALALKFRLFVDMCNASDEWLKDSTFRLLV
jgi:hypothetical protein